ncbi:MAG: NAD(P)H-dependent oxidoreductase [Patescibacteria group bacterium]
MDSKILILNFSLRKNSGSEKIANYIQNQIKGSESLNYIDMDLPLWNEDVWTGGEFWKERLTPIKAKLKDCDGLIFVVPEYCGSHSPALSNFITLIGSYSDVSHKPCLLVANSSSRGGAYPIAEIKGFCSKNNRIVFIPEHIIVRNNGEVLNDTPKDDNHEDVYIRSRIEYAIKALLEYSYRLKGLGDILKPPKGFENGM